MTYYYLYKQGVYGQGVYWVGTDLEEGKRTADMWATNDVDAYHVWELWSYPTPSDTCLYTGERAAP